MEYMKIVYLLASAIVFGGVGYFFWKFRQIDTHATKTELAEVQADIMEFIPSDVITSEDCGHCAGNQVEEVFARHAEEQRIESQRQTDDIIERLGEIKTDLGREIGQIKESVNKLDERLYNHVTSDKPKVARS